MTTGTQTLIPAAIRHRNPGAMALGKSAKLFGSTTSTTLRDADRNTIATFPTSVDGAGAMFHLLHTVYAGMNLWDAMHKWGDGATLVSNGQVEKGRTRTEGYVQDLERWTRWTRADNITKAMLEDPETAIEFGKAMARHEAGIEYPMEPEQWREAHAEFLTVLAGGYIKLDKAKPTPVLAPLNLARSHLGEHEIAGAEDNPFIVSCFADIGSRIRDDETSWCAAFVGAILKAAGYAYLEDVLEARKYLDYGHAIDEPEEGCIVVFWRVHPDSWQGHVAFVESWTATTLTIIGGNQWRDETRKSDAVTRVTVPRTGPKSQVLGYRRAVSALKPVTEVLADESMQRKAVGLLGTVGALLWSAWGAVEGAAHFVGEFMGALPETAAGVGQTVGAAQQLSESAGLPWPFQLGLLITVISLAFGAYATWRRLRPHDGAVTRPPYETDVTPPAVTGDVDDAFGNVISLEAERRKRRAKATPAPRRKANAKAKRRAVS